MPLAPSELILNPDGSIYHLHLKPEQLARTIITVGDPERVASVSKHFDTILHTVQKREFKTITGIHKNKEISVISTGIGTDNIDIVFNELDALVNIDFESREIRKELVSLDIVRIGTSGAIQKDIPVDSFLMSAKAVGLDALLHFYDSEHVQDLDFQQAFIEHMDWAPQKSKPYVVSCDETLASKFASPQMREGITATNIGFYGPQGRVLRLRTSDEEMNDKLARLRFPMRARDRFCESVITNLEMETSGIYGLAKLMGHRAVSLNAILANRATNEFSNQPQATIDALITYTLERLSN